MSSEKLEKKLKEYKELKKRLWPSNIDPTSDLMVDYLKNQSMEEFMVQYRDTTRALELLLDIIREATGEKSKAKTQKNKILR